MTVRQIIQAPDDRLLRRCAKIISIDDRVRLLAEDLVETRRHHDGLGLAAPQVGESVRLVAFNPGRVCGYPIVVNPEIIARGNNQSWGDEGCLSIDGGKRFVRVRRWDTVTMRFQTLRGATAQTTIRGLAARIAQHEIDHLDGKLIA